jgi:hypothetical protein
MLGATLLKAFDTRITHAKTKGTLIKVAFSGFSHPVYSEDFFHNGLNQRFLSGSTQAPCRRAALRLCWAWNR